MFVDDRRPVGDWLSENYIDNLSPTSDNHFFGGCFSEEFGGRQMIVDDRRPVGDWSAIGCQNSWSVRGFRCSIENLSPTKLLERLQSTGRGSELKWCGHFQHTLFTSDSRDHKLEKTGGVHSLECQPVHACCLCTS